MARDLGASAGRPYCGRLGLDGARTAAVGSDIACFTAIRDTRRIAPNLAQQHRRAHMRRIAALAGIFIAAMFAGVLIARAGPEHDTTHDGVVDLRDALDVLHHFGESPGTP